MTWYVNGLRNKVEQSILGVSTATNKRYLLWIDNKQVGNTCKIQSFGTLKHTTRPASACVWTSSQLISLSIDKFYLRVFAPVFVSACALLVVLVEACARRESLVGWLTFYLVGPAVFQCMEYHWTTKVKHKTLYFSFFEVLAAITRLTWTLRARFTRMYTNAS
jgi:hypothetical protein